MKAWLTRSEGVPFLECIRGEAVVGRVTRCDVVLLDNEVSSRHAVIRWQDGRMVLEDAGSRTGTYVGETRIEGPVTLREGVKVRFGKTVLEVTYRPPSRAAAFAVLDDFIGLEDKVAQVLADPAADPLARVIDRLLLEIMPERAVIAGVATDGRVEVLHGMTAGGDPVPSVMSSLVRPSLESRRARMHPEEIFDAARPAPDFDPHASSRWIVLPLIHSETVWGALIMEWLAWPAGLTWGKVLGVLERVAAQVAEHPELRKIRVRGGTGAVAIPPDLADLPAHVCPRCGRRNRVGARDTLLIVCDGCHVRYVSPDATMIPSISSTGSMSSISSDPGSTRGERQPIELDDAFRAKYRLESLLGSGASGAVYRASRIGDDRPLAIKFLLRTERPQMMARFLREARLLREMDHPCVLACFDVDQLKGHPYFVCEFMDGGSLKDLLKEKGRLEPGEAHRIIVAVLKGLEACHRSAILHRDVKPGNILLTAGGQVKIADLGLAVHRESEDTILTLHGQVMGTLLYAAPEQLLGEEATAAADVFSAAVVLHEMLAGRPPLDVTSIARAIVELQEGKRTPLAALLPEHLRPIASVVDHALAYSPDDRPKDASAFLQLLEAPEILACLQPPPPAPSSTPGTRISGSTAVIPGGRRSRPIPVIQAEAPEITAGRRVIPSLEDESGKLVAFFSVWLPVLVISGNLEATAVCLLLLASVGAWKVIPILLALVHSRPTLVVGPEGIHDRRWGFGPVAWSQVKSAHSVSEGVAATVRLQVSDIDRQLGPLSPMRRRITEMIFITRTRVKSPQGVEIQEEAILLIYLDGLDLKGINLVQEIQTRIGIGFRKSGRPTRTYLPERPAPDTPQS